MQKKCFRPFGDTFQTDFCVEFFCVFFELSFSWTCPVRLAMFWLLQSLWTSDQVMWYFAANSSVNIPLDLKQLLQDRLDIYYILVVRLHFSNETFHKVAQGLYLISSYSVFNHLYHSSRQYESVFISIFTIPVAGSFSKKRLTRACPANSSTDPT